MIIGIDNGDNRVIIGDRPQLNSDNRDNRGQTTIKLVIKIKRGLSPIVPIVALS